MEIGGVQGGGLLTLAAVHGCQTLGKVAHQFDVHPDLVASNILCQAIGDLTEGLSTKLHPETIKSTLTIKYPAIALV